MLSTKHLRLWLALALIAGLTACASKSPSGYGLEIAKSTAQQAQEQMQSAEQATQVDTAQTYLDLIAQMQQAGQWYASLAHAEVFEQKYGSSAQSRLLRADALRNTGQLEAAQAIYQSLLTGSSAARAQRGLGLLHASQQRYAQAVLHLEQARQLNPIDASVLSDLAYAQMLDGHLQAARLPAMQAAQLAPGNAKVQLNLALYLLASNQTEQAHRVLEQLTQSSSKSQQGTAIDPSSIAALQAQVPRIQQATRLRTELSTPVTAAPISSTSPAASDTPALPSQASL